MSHTQTITHYQVCAETFTDEQGPAVALTQQQDGTYEPDTVNLHPWQLRAICEEIGIIASDQAAQKTIATSTRRLLMLRDRIAHLSEYLDNHSDREHANLEYEQVYATATADLASEFCAELQQSQALPSSAMGTA